MSYCRSSGCNYRPCSQSQKMSIGIVVDSVAKPHHGSTKEAEVSIKQVETGVSNQERLMVGQNVKQAFKTSGYIKMCKEYVGEESSSIKTGPLTVNMLMKDSDHIEQQPSRSAMSVDKQATQSHHFFRKQIVSQAGSGKNIKPGLVVSGKEGKGDVTAERYEEFPDEDNQEICMSFKDMLQDQPTEMDNRSKETLRMKLRELLGTVPSVNNELGDARTAEVGANEVTQDPTHECDAHFKPRKDSDTIETDSENANMTIRRKVTRSLSRKRVPAKTSPRKLKTKSLSCGKVEFQFPAKISPRNLKTKSLSCGKVGFQVKDVFSFAEKSAASPPCAVNFGFLMPEKNDNDKGIKQDGMLFHETDVVNIERVISEGKKIPPVEEFPSDGKMKSPEHEHLNVNLVPDKSTLNTNVNHSSIIREKDQQRDADCPVSPEESDHHKSFDHQSPVYDHDNQSSPLFKMTRTVPSSRMSFSPLSNEKKHHVHASAQARGEVNVKGTCVFRSRPAIKENSGSSDDAATPEKAYVGTPELFKEVDEAENELFTPERRDFDSIGEDSSAEKVHSEDLCTSPKTEVIGKPMLFRSKWHCSHGVDSGSISPTLHSPGACGTTDDAFMEGLEENPEDGLTRVVSLLGLALKRVNNKMMSVTNKICSDILLSAAEEIHSQLQNVESQIQTDLGKLTSLNKTKRKHIETRLQEQHRNLNAIYDKFKEEINNYLQDCRGQMEVLEAQHVELKAANERKQESHRKLLLQADTTVETHLNDAQRRVTSVHKLGRQKMRKLKVAIAECLKDVVSS